MESNWSRRLFEGFHLCEKDRWAWTTQNSSFHIFPFISSFLMSDDDGQKNCSKICLELYNCCCIVGNLIFYIILELLQIGTVQNSKNILPRKLIPTSIHLDFSTLKKKTFYNNLTKMDCLGSMKNMLRPPSFFRFEGGLYWSLIFICEWVLQFEAFSVLIMMMTYSSCIVW